MWKVEGRRVEGRKVERRKVVEKEGKGWPSRDRASRKKTWGLACGDG